MEAGSRVQKGERTSAPLLRSYWPFRFTAHVDVSIKVAYLYTEPTIWTTLSSRTNTP